MERYWLCDECAAGLTLTFDQSHGIVTVPLPDTPRQRILTGVHLQELPTPPQIRSAAHESAWAHARYNVDKLRLLTCTICGLQPSGRQRWFLVSEDRWRDKLRILHWDDDLATREGIHSACTPEHLQELVVHWMATGSLDHPFARSSSRIDLNGYHRRTSLTSRADLPPWRFQTDR